MQAPAHTISEHFITHEKLCTDLGSLPFSLHPQPKMTLTDWICVLLLFQVCVPAFRPGLVWLDD